MTYNVPELGPHGIVELEASGVQALLHVDVGVEVVVVGGKVDKVTLLADLGHLLLDPFDLQRPKDGLESVSGQWTSSQRETYGRIVF